MRIINRHGFPLNDDLYEYEDGSPVDRDNVYALRDLVRDLNNNFDDAPFSIIENNEIPNWVRDYEARQALGAKD